MKQGMKMRYKGQKRKYEVPVEDRRLITIHKDVRTLIDLYAKEHNISPVQAIYELLKIAFVTVKILDNVN